jgi:hypothetical protein
VTLAPKIHDVVNPSPRLSVEEFRARLLAEIDVLNAEIEAFDEHYAISHPPLTDAEITERALDALQRLERFNGEHNVARGWLRECAPNAGIFTKKRA